jgi:hypothetical protein
MMSANLVARCLCQQVHDAGHMVPMDQPEASLEMLKRWTRGSLSEATEEPQQLVAEIWWPLSSINKSDRNIWFPWFFLYPCKYYFLTDQTES